MLSLYLKCHINGKILWHLSYSLKRAINLTVTQGVKKNHWKITGKIEKLSDFALSFMLPFYRRSQRI